MLVKPPSPIETFMIHLKMNKSKPLYQPRVTARKAQRSIASDSLKPAPRSIKDKRIESKAMQVEDPGTCEMHEETIETNTKQDYHHNDAFPHPDAAGHDSNSDAFEECELATDRTNDIKFKDIEVSNDRIDTIDGQAHKAGNGTDDETQLDGNPTVTDDMMDKGAFEVDNKQVPNTSSSHLKQIPLTDDIKLKSPQTHSKQSSQHAMFSDNPFTALISNHNDKRRSYNKSSPRSTDVTHTVRNADLMKNQTAHNKSNIVETATGAPQIDTDTAKMDADPQDDHYSHDINGIQDNNTANAHMQDSQRLCLTPTAWTHPPVNKPSLVKVPHPFKLPSRSFSTKRNFGTLKKNRKQVQKKNPKK